ncbi:hypothetical protein WISP_46355 [Willisornis vidua]|uniref:Uncharacterized protein n=1 Tax=Willisornis vidua TaxID=1566151 RepID=A0ABQ9DJQ5_9PASS|nr:hypothetical protein WISP_46355 [Willisornis vidua]
MGHRFNKAQFKVLHLCKGNPHYEYRLEDEGIENSLAEKDLGVLMDDKLDMSWQCALPAEQANCVLGYIKSSVANRSREVILALYSVLMKSRLEYCFQLWSPQHKERHGLLEWVQRTSVVMSVEEKINSQKHRIMELFWLEKTLEVIESNP